MAVAIEPHDAPSDDLGTYSIVDYIFDRRIWKISRVGRYSLRGLSMA